MKTTILLLGLAILFVSCSINEYETAALKFLKDNYELDWEGGQGSDLLKNGHIFYQEGKPPTLKRLHSPYLKSKIGFEFFETTLSTVHYEAPLTILTIAVNIEEGRIEILNSFTPDSQRKFTCIFKGLKLISPEDKLKASEEIGNLLNSFVNFEKMELERKVESNFEEIIYSGDNNILAIKFEANTISEIQMVNSMTSEIE